MSGQAELAIVCARFKESLAWVTPVLDAFPSTHLFLFDCGARPIGGEIVNHPRVTIHDKQPRTTLYWAYLEYCRQYYDQLPDYVLFCHGHNRSWHQRLPLMEVLRSLHACMPFDYVNIGDRVYPDWLDERSEFAACTRKLWLQLQAILDAPSIGPRLVEINAGQACVSKQAIRGRDRETWRELAQFASGCTHHSNEDYGFEGCFHVIMSQPWERPVIVRNLETLLYRPLLGDLGLFIKQFFHPRVNELILRGGR